MLTLPPLVREAALGIRAMTRMAALGSAGHLSQAAANVQRYKEESAQEVMEVSSFLAGIIAFNGDDGVQDAAITHHHNQQPSEDGVAGDGPLDEERQPKS
jgi:hypothetical protein